MISCVAGIYIQHVSVFIVLLIYWKDSYINCRRKVTHKRVHWYNDQHACFLDFRPILYNWVTLDQLHKYIDQFACHWIIWIFFIIVWCRPISSSGSLFIVRFNFSNVLILKIGRQCIAIMNTTITMIDWRHYIPKISFHIMANQLEIKLRFSGCVLLIFSFRDQKKKNLAENLRPLFIQYVTNDLAATFSVDLLMFFRSNNFFR